MSLLHFPSANQAQIIRANQRDLFHIASLREQIEALLRTWFGTRWVLRWGKEISLCAKFAYFGLTIRYASQTLGEEYTDIWQQVSNTPGLPSRKLRGALVLFSSLPPYLIGRIAASSNEPSAGSRFAALLRRLPTALDIISEANLAMFYFQGVYYDVARRAFRMHYISSLPPNPNVSPPSYSFLGLLLAIRLTYRLITYLRSLSPDNAHGSPTRHGKRPIRYSSSSQEPTIDSRAVSSILAASPVEERDPVPAEQDEYTILHVSSLSAEDRAARRCTLCLEERTSSCATECGHLFCWICVLNWGREKPECPLCRQSLDLNRLLPIYNL